MTKSCTIFKAGTRGSKLALTQTGNALRRIHSYLPAVDFETVNITTPGDRDKQLDLRASAADFFTYDLDMALLNGEIDCAVHSAKDLPDKLMDGIDVVWLPWREDPRDVLILREGMSVSELPDDARVGISSERREAYCRECFPNSRQLPIRGNIDDRIQQLDEDKYDFLVMAAAGLKRLGLAHRITEYIPLSVLAPPAGQGYLAMTFRQDDERFLTMRRFFVKPVVFAGSGPGDPALITVAAREALQHCDVCLYDALSPVELLSELPGHAEAVYVGKRKGQHSMKQDEINQLIVDYARQTKRVVRLKGGDPGIFGRLTEEVNALTEYALPYRVIPGISSMLSATTGTGLLLTKRGTSRGFSVLTPRRSGSSEFEPVTPDERVAFPLVCFMGASEVENLCRQLIDEGRSSSEPVSIVYGAGRPGQQVVSGTLATMPGLCAELKSSLPGLLLIGEIADPANLYQSFGALAGQRVLLTCSDAVMPRAELSVTDCGGIPVPMPLIELQSESSCVLSDIADFDWVVLTSPSAVRCFFTQLQEQAVDVRRVPKVMVCGPGTAAEVASKGLKPDLNATGQFGANGLLAAAKSVCLPGVKVLRLRSDKAGSALSDSLVELGFNVTDRILYRNVKRTVEELPPCDAIVFASASAVQAFATQWGNEALTGRRLAVIGEPTRQALTELGLQLDVVVAASATIEETVLALAAGSVNTLLEDSIS